MLSINPIGLTKNGFVIPDGYSWDATLKDGKKEGVVKVHDNYGCLSHILHFRNDQLNGICEFYNYGSLVEKRTFVNNVAEGWGCKIKYRKEVKWYLYSDGEQKAELIPCDDMKDYWKALEIPSEQLLSICKYDNDHKRDGKCYLYDNGHISRIVLFENGNEKHVYKEFNNDTMTEYDSNGMVYKGEYLDDPSKDYLREGGGLEFDNGILVYIGEWKNGLRDGEGKTLKSLVNEYEGELKDGEGKTMKSLVTEYEGGWKEGLPDGFGVLERDGEVYEGEWEMGKLKLREGGWYDYINGKKKRNDERTIIEKDNQLTELLMSDQLKMNVSELVIGYGCGNSISDSLELFGFGNLEKIMVSRNSLKNLSMLRISDNPVLETIEIEYGYWSSESDVSGPFSFVKTVVIECMMIYD